MKQMNLHDIPDEVYATLAESAQAHHQSLNAFVVDRLAEVARVLRLADYPSSYEPPPGAGITLDDAVAALRGERDAS
jgi:hypothetical protein